MWYYSILFEEPGTESFEKQDGFPKSFKDLNLDQIVDKIIQDRDEYCLAEFFCSPLKTISAVNYRLEVMKDLENPDLYEALVSFSHGMQKVRNYSEFSNSLHHKAQREKWRLDAASLYCGKTTFARSFGQILYLASIGCPVPCFSAELCLPDWIFTHFAREESLSLNAGRLKEDLFRIKEIIEILGARFGKGLKGTGYVLRKLSRDMENHPHGIRNRKRPQWNEIILNNISTARSAREMEDAGLIQILRVVNHFNGIIQRFFEALHFEAGFYAASVNLYSTLSSLGAPVCFPDPLHNGTESLKFRGLYDISLALHEKRKPVQNDMDGDGIILFIITGANQGGKSTFIRSIAQAQLLMQCGLFVPALSFCSAVGNQIFTHFTREEDACMNSGKLEEELLRMNEIISVITPGSILFMNECFSSTTEREGSKIACDIITALIESGIRVFFVTHLFEFANALFCRNPGNVLFLRAGREENGSRSFVISPGKTLRTSFGEDLFNGILGRINIV